MTVTSRNIDDYNLRACNTQEERRNFKGVHVYKNGLPLTDNFGTTETDSKTDTKDPGYSNIYGGKNLGIDLGVYTHG